MGNDKYFVVYEVKLRGHEKNELIAKHDQIYL